MVDVVADAETPMISMAASARIVDPANPKTKWVFKTPQSDSLMADAIAVHMKANGVKTMGYIGFADAYGDGWLAEMKRSAQTAGIKVVAEEKYNRNDASVTGQVLKLVAANPDAILIGAAGTPGRDAAEGAGRAQLQGQDLPDARRRQSRLPARRRQGRQRHDPADRPDAGLRAAARLATRSRRSAAEYITKYEAKFGKDSRSTFGGHAWDSYLLLARAIPEALKKAQAGHEGVPRGAARRARERRRSWSRRTACTR